MERASPANPTAGRGLVSIHPKPVSARGPVEPRSPAVTDALIAEMVDLLVKEADPEQVILFGSRGRGDAHGDSDVDLIVVEAEPFGAGRNRVREMARLYRVLGGFAVPLDILVYSLDDVEYWRDSRNHVLARALRDGRVLYERP